MHNAPAVIYPAGRSFLAGAALLATWLAGASGFVLWSVQARASSVGIALASTAVLFGGAVALRGWLHSPVGALSWDGRDWTWTAGSTTETGTPEVALDVQRLLLLRWQGGGHPAWLWLERSVHPALWDDLRRAVYSRAKP
jgi:hypothetical protein